MVIRPISVIRESKVKDRDFNYVIGAIKSLLLFFDVADKISVTESSMVIASGGKIEDYLMKNVVPKMKTEMIDTTALDSLIRAGARIRHGTATKPAPYLVTVVDRDLRWYREDLRQISGLSSPAESVIISVRRDKYTDPFYLEERIRKTTMHEMGHMFGLIPNCRTTDVDIEYWHCTNRCIMQHGDLPFLGLSGEIIDPFLFFRFCSQCRDCLRWIFKGGQISHSLNP